MKVGDTIKCSDADDMIETMTSLARAGIETDFDYSQNDSRLVVTKIQKVRNENEQI